MPANENDVDRRIKSCTGGHILGHIMVHGQCFLWCDLVSLDWAKHYEIKYIFYMSTVNVLNRKNGMIAFKILAELYKMNSYASKIIELSMNTFQLSSIRWKRRWKRNGFYLKKTNASF